MYPNYYSPVPTEVLKGFYKKDHALSLTNLLEVETMQNEKYRISADRENKLLVVSKPENKISGISPVDLDSILQFCSSIDYKISYKGYKVYTLNLVDGYIDFRALEIFINPRTYMLESLSVYFRTAINIDQNDPNSRREIPKVEISYSNLNINPRFPAGLFSERKYVKERNGALIASGNYADYEVINLNLNQQ